MELDIDDSGLPFFFDNSFLEVQENFTLFQDIFIGAAGKDKEHLGYFKIFKQELRCEKYRTKCQRISKIKANFTIFKRPWDQIPSYKFQENDV